MLNGSSFKVMMFSSKKTLDIIVRDVAAILTKKQGPHEHVPVPRPEILYVFFALYVYTVKTKCTNLDGSIYFVSLWVLMTCGLLYSGI